MNSESNTSHEPSQSEEEEQDLFRKEAVAEQGQKIIGEVILLWRPKLVALVAFYSVFAFVGLCLVLFGSYQRKERVRGKILPKQGLVSIVSDTSGSVKELMVKDGEWVDEGQPLLTISRESFLNNNKGRFEELVGELENRIAKAEEKRRQIEKNSDLESKEIFNKIKHLEQSSLQADMILSRKMIQKAEADKTLASAKQLYREKIISRSEYENRLNIAMSIDESIAEETRKKASFDHSLKEKMLHLEKLKESIRLQILVSDQEVSELQIRLIDFRSQEAKVLKANRPGYVSGIITHPGQAITPGQVLLTLVPRDFDLEVHLFVSTHAAPFIKIGQDVWLQLESFPLIKYGTFAARVKEISRAPLNPNEIRMTGISESSYLVKAELLDESSLSLKKVDHIVASTLQADILVGKRLLIEWILDPFFRAKGMHGLE